jgi:flagellar P-ring protein precursor FlgI
MMIRFFHLKLLTRLLPFLNKNDEGTSMICFLLLFLVLPAQAEDSPIIKNDAPATIQGSRIKDLVTVKGVRENPLIGYGLVIGLNGTGDGGGEILNASMKRMFQKLGLNPQSEMASKNVASVLVTAQLPPFGRVGQKLDVHISSVANASSLAGGTLLVTPLKGGDGQIYAVATGQITVGGLKQGSKFATNARISQGATLEKEMELDFDSKKSLRLSLNDPDFTTAYRIQRVINSELGGRFASAKDATTIDLIIPPFYERKVVELMALVENFRVIYDLPSKIVINERTGTIVMGGDIRLKPFAVGHGDLTIEVQSKGGAAGGNQKKGGGEKIFFVEEQATLKDLVQSLNSLGLAPEDFVSIFQTLKKQGAINAEIEFI